MLPDLFDTFFGGALKPPETLALRLLGLAALPTTEEEVRSAFKERLRAVHPDTADDPEATETANVSELVWAREAVLFRVQAAVMAARSSAEHSPSVTAPVTDGEGVLGTFSSRNVCAGCGGERLNVFGKPYKVGRTRRWPRLCDSCAMESENARRREERRVARAGRVCPVCGVAFDPPRSDARYCSAACRQRAYRRRA